MSCWKSADLADVASIPTINTCSSRVPSKSAIAPAAEERPGYQLAVSLHAPNDALRSQIVPTNDKTGLLEILQAADEYFSASGRRLTFEYVLLAGLNDGENEARQLARLLRGKGVLVNLIPYNPVAGLPYAEPSRSDVDRFASTLEQAGVNVQVRRRKGDAIDAACGQLRRLRSDRELHELGGPQK